jgi:hypothetical protein
MKKATKKLQLSKTTINNLSQQNMLQLKGGIAPTNVILCQTRPLYCGTTVISNCTACYSCIECAAPPETFYNCNVPKP